MPTLLSIHAPAKNTTTIDFLHSNQTQLFTPTLRPAWRAGLSADVAFRRGSNAEPAIPSDVFIVRQELVLFFVDEH